MITGWLLESKNVGLKTMVFFVAIHPSYITQIHPNPSERKYMAYDFIIRLRGPSFSGRSGSKGMYGYELWGISQNYLQPCGLLGLHCLPIRIRIRMYRYKYIYICTTTWSLLQAPDGQAVTMNHHESLLIIMCNYLTILLTSNHYQSPILPFRLMNDFESHLLELSKIN